MQKLNNGELTSNRLSSLLLACLLAMFVFPLQYVSDLFGNYLVIQVVIGACIVLLLFRNSLDYSVLYVLGIIVAYFIAVSAFNINELISVASNPVPLIVGVSMLVLLKKRASQINIHIMRSAIEVLIIAFTVFSVYLNAEHIITYGLERTKGFGSGTLYATFSVVAIAYWLRQYSISRLRFVWLILLCAPMLWSILLTQSRGSLMVFLLVIILIGVESRYVFRLVLLAGILIAGLLVMYPEIAGMGVLGRLNQENYASSEDFSSGRLVTQWLIMDAFIDESSLNAVLFGNGFNSLKKLVDVYELEFPHLDALYILHDGGVISLAVFGMLAIAIIKRSHYKVYPLIFFLSGFHTNMIMSPTLLLMLHFIELADVKAKISNGISQKSKMGRIASFEHGVHI